MLKRMVMIILLGGFGIMMLTACNKKSSREFIEGKAAELSNVYPTEDLQDLFEKFPDGFSIQSDDLYDYKEEGYSFQSIKLEGDSKTKSITGTILWKKVTSNVSIKHPRLLLQKFIINKESLSALKMDLKSYSYETGSAFISYFITDSVLNNYMEVDQDTQLRMIVHIMRNTLENKAFSYTVDIRHGQNSHAELISGGKINAVR